jgi:hypothetical protein
MKNFAKQFLLYWIILPKTMKFIDMKLHPSWRRPPAWGMYIFAFNMGKSAMKRWERRH